MGPRMMKLKNICGIWVGRWDLRTFPLYHKNSNLLAAKINFSVYVLVRGVFNFGSSYLLTSLDRNQLLFKIEIIHPILWHIMELLKTKNLDIRAKLKNTRPSAIVSISVVWGKLICICVFNFPDFFCVHRLVVNCVAQEPATKGMSTTVIVTRWKLRFRTWNTKLGPPASTLSICRDPCLSSPVAPQCLWWWCWDTWHPSTQSDKYFTFIRHRISWVVAVIQHTHLHVWKSNWFCTWI